MDRARRLSITVPAVRSNMVITTTPQADTVGMGTSVSHVEEHPSPLSVLPSSYCSVSGHTSPSPHVAPAPAPVQSALHEPQGSVYPSSHSSLFSGHRLPSPQFPRPTPGPERKRIGSAKPRGNVGDVDRLLALPIGWLAGTELIPQLAVLRGGSRRPALLIPRNTSSNPISCGRYQAAPASNE